MAKSKTLYFCTNCGYESPKWVGRCPSCGEWNSFTEEVVTATKRGGTGRRSAERATPVALSDVTPGGGARIATGIGEVDRLLGGGGVVKGSLLLMGGEPGIGKSTLALQIAVGVGGRRVLYVSGEESEQQIKLRAERLEGSNDECLLLGETDVDAIINSAVAAKPELLIVDSVQTLSTQGLDSAAGSVSQIRESASRLLRYTKESGIPVVLIGHITKDGTLAGPKVLEHIVDVVLLFEGDTDHLYRILRATKNRFGSTAELGIFEMTASGLHQVANPSGIFINRYDEVLSGVAVAAVVDGLRPFMIETQALVSSAVYGTPQRSSTGFDTRRLNMLLAVLEKRAGFKLAMRDVFLNIAGGLKVSDPATDLAVAAAVLSSNLDIPLAGEICFAGEVGLSGEIRPVARIEQRMKEASRLGFKKIVISRYHRSDSLPDAGIEPMSAGRVEAVVKMLFS